MPGPDTLTLETVAEIRNSTPVSDRVVFSVESLYGLSTESVRLPLNKTEYIDSGQICLTIDPDTDASNNVGIIDFETRKLRVSYGVHAVFPGLYELATSRKYDAALLAPVRLVATDECSLNSDDSGWEARGCLDFLPGSIWAGTDGG